MKIYKETNSYTVYKKKNKYQFVHKELPVQVEYKEYESGLIDFLKAVNKRLKFEQAVSHLTEKQRSLIRMGIRNLNDFLPN